MQPKLEVFDDVDDLNKARLTVKQKFLTDFPAYSAGCLMIRTKDQGLKPFKLNKAQLLINAMAEQQLARRGFVRLIILKGRQMGCSTYIQGRAYWRATTRFGYRVFILTHESEATTNLFEMTRRFHEKCPDMMKPSCSSDSSRGLAFDKLESGYKVGTAGGKGAGRSQTIQFLHGSEVAFWPNAEEHAAGVMQAVPKGGRGTEIYLESTANGVGNLFHKQWMMAERGDSDFEPVFIPWYLQDEYRVHIPDGQKISLDNDEKSYAELYELDDEQMLWRREKIQSEFAGNLNFFQQEFPANTNEAFLSESSAVLIPVEPVTRARKTRGLELVGPRLLGVDPARFGDDRTAWAFRVGRVAPWAIARKKLDTMDIVGKTVQLIREYDIDRVFVDVIGIGAGVVDRLVELGYGGKVVPVNGAERAIDSNRYANKRAEMWCELRDWLYDTPCALPDNESLQTDLCSLTYKHDSKSRWLMEKKEDAKKRGIASPDLGDALAMTFAQIGIRAGAGQMPESFEPEF